MDGQRENNENSESSTPMGGDTSVVAPEETQNSNNSDKQHYRHHHNRHHRHRIQKQSLLCCCFRKKQQPISEERKSLSEEARLWSKNFERLLRHPGRDLRLGKCLPETGEYNEKYGQKIFQEFLQSQFSDENLRFWLEAEKYRNLPEEERKKRAGELFNDFVSSISPCEVSLNSHHKVEIESQLEEAHSELFKPAQDYIFNLMYTDCLPRFLKSKTYTRLCR